MREEPDAEHEMFSERGKIVRPNGLAPQLYIWLIYQITIFYLLRTVGSQIEHDLDTACRKNLVFCRYRDIRLAHKITLYVIF